MTLSGDGSITGLVAGGLPDATVIQADLAAGVAGNGPAFSAYQSSAQTISTATATKVQFNSEDFDTNSNYDNVTNYRFTPTVAGYYQVNASISFAISGAQAIYIYKNGALYKAVSSPASAVGVVNYIGALISMNGSADYLEIYCYQSSGGSASLTVSPTAYNSFSASMVRSA